jgi:exo-beta-1,3-glucanase (GH17 family)/cellulose synthase/poly-beta-1,6-N-acetylglucosamine synthase-like glycosyltransferase
MRKILLLFLIVGITFAAWEIANPPIAEPEWTGRIDGFAYSPMRPGQTPERREFPSEAEIEADIAIIAAHARSLRTYSLDGTLARIPETAARHGLDVTAGVWLDADHDANRARLARLEQLVASHSNIERVIVGNETLLEGVLTPAELAGYLDTMRESLGVPVGTAEPWHVWLANPALAEHVEFIAVHLLPYWEGIPARDAISVVEARMSELESTFPGLPVVIGEAGWPSNGRSRGAAAASRAQAETFLRRFLAAAERRGYEYFVMEAFDQPWKRADEGEVGAYWGVFDGARRAKYGFDATFRAVPERRALALTASVLAAAIFLALAADSRRMRWPGLALFAATSFAAANAVVWSGNDYLQQYWTVAGMLAAAVLLAGLLAIVLLVCIEVHEWAEAAFKPRSRSPVSTAARAATRWPKVSIHVPVHEEPPALVIESLNALAQLGYADFEVLVIDNNTSNDALWRPVAARCAELGERFRFFHVAPLQGFKAGALNFAAERTAPDAEIIAVIDSDYRVEPDWLRSLVPHFAAPEVALVQAPQDYRDHGTQPFKALCEAEYRGFFQIGMVTRNERNAIIQHGTMTMIRARVLREVGGWAEWTVTEDAELGLRILEHGYESIYTTESHGRGVTPDRFRDYRAQRYRWAIGATQILRRHGRKLLGLEPAELSVGQRFHFLTGWAAWLGDGLNLVFNVIAIAWSALMVLSPLEFLAPVAKFSSFVLAFFVFKIVKVAWLYRRRVGATLAETTAAIVAGLSLVFITGRAVVAGLAGSDARFVRTPKLAARDGLLGALAGVASEGLLAAALLTLAVAVTLTAPFESLDRRLWSVLLVVFAVPHLAAVALSVLSTLPPSVRTRPVPKLGTALTGARKA